MTSHSKHAMNIINVKKYCTTVRAICHTQVRKVTNLGQKKAHIMEIQVRSPPSSASAYCSVHLAGGQGRTRGSGG